MKRKLYREQVKEEEIRKCGAKIIARASGSTKMGYSNYHIICSLLLCVSPGTTFGGCGLHLITFICAIYINIIMANWFKIRCNKINVLEQV